MGRKVEYIDPSGRKFIFENTRPTDGNPISLMRYELKSEMYTTWNEDFNKIRGDKDMKWYAKQLYIKFKVILRKLFKEERIYYYYASKKKNY